MTGRTGGGAVAPRGTVDGLHRALDHIDWQLQSVRLTRHDGDLIIAKLALLADRARSRVFVVKGADAQR